MHKDHQIGVGILGLGHWGPHHVRVINSLAETKVVAVVDKDEKRLNSIGKLYPQVGLAKDAQVLFENPDIHAVVVVTPTNTHFGLVRQALEAGKHVFCEKPLCLSSTEADQLVELARLKGRVLMVGHIFLFNPGLRKIKELIDSGELGKILCLAANRTNLGPVRSDVNAAYDLASHDIAIFNWLLGAEPLDVSAMGASFLQKGVEDVVNISMKYPGNVLASVHCSWLDPKKVRHITVVGDKKMATWDDLNLTSPVAIYEKGAKSDTDAETYGEFLRISMWEGDVRMPKVSQREPLLTQAECFIASITRGQENPTDAAFAAGVVRVLEKIENSLRGREAIVAN